MKKKNEPIKDLKLNFTGKASVLLELEDYGPMQYRINDLDTVMKIVRIILDASDHTTDVNAYGKREQKTFTKILDDIT